MAKHNFFIRTVKDSKKGPYINYGSCRLRIIKGKTNFKIGEQVHLIIHPYRHYVFNSLDFYEEWVWLWYKSK